MSSESGRHAKWVLLLTACWTFSTWAQGTDSGPNSAPNRVQSNDSKQEVDAAYVALKRRFDVWRAEPGQTQSAAVQETLRDLFDTANALLSQDGLAASNEELTERLRALARIRAADRLLEFGDEERAWAAYTTLLDESTDAAIVLLAERRLQAIEPPKDLASERDAASLGKATHLASVGKTDEARATLYEVIESTASIEIVQQAKEQLGTLDTIDELASVRDEARFQSAMLLVSEGEIAEARAALNELFTTASSTKMVQRARDALQNIAVVDPTPDLEQSKLSEAKSLARNGKLAEARALYTEVLTNTRYDETRKDASAKLAALPTTPTLGMRTWSAWSAFLEHTATFITWTLNFALVVVVITVFYCVLDLIRRTLGRRRKSWRLEPFESKDAPYMGELLLSAIDEASKRVQPRNFGHYTLIREPIDAVVRGNPPTPQWEFSELIFPTLGQIKSGPIVKLLASMPRWLRGPNRRIWPHWTVANDKLTLSLSLWATRDRVVSVMAEGAYTISETTKLAREVGEKVVHLITRPEATARDAGAAIGLREGRAQLQYYQDGGGKDALSKAEQYFKAATIASDHSDESMFYLGLTLDLAEKHEEAIKIFHRLSHSSLDSELRQWSAVNEAVARLRKYEPAELIKAERDLRDLYRHKGEGAILREPVTPFDAIVMLKLADVLAHKPIFPEFRGDVNDILNNVINFTNIVQEAIDPLSKSEDWDEDMTRSCKWSIHNARGNVALNIALDDKIIKLPIIEPLNSKKIGQDFQTNDTLAEETDRRHRLLKYALANFQQTEITDHLGVETLSNLGTVYDRYARHLSKESIQAAVTEPTEEMKGKALEYLERCIEINAHYEYGYYRLADHWLETCANPGEAKKVVERFLGNQLTPSIPGFIDLIRRLEM